MKTNVKRLAAFGRAGLLLIATALLAACSQTVPRGLPSSNPLPLSGGVTATPATGEVIGNGETRVALLLPLSAEGNGGRIAAEFRNAALMALEDAGADALQIVIKDTESGVEAAAASAVAEGAALVLGPVFAPNVRNAAAMLGPRGPTMIAFSSDRTVARHNVYLNSYLPEGLIDRILSHAVSQGYRRVVAIVPTGAAGDIDEAQARATLTRAGGELVAVSRYDYDNASVQAAAQDVAMAVADADAIFLPDGGSSPSAIVAALTRMGVDLREKRLLGTGQWASVDLTDPNLQGAWFADTDRARMSLYKARYRQRFGTEPSVTSALGYDSVLLTATLVRSGSPAAAISPADLEVPAGFAGYTGAFRFRSDGTPQRGYAVYEVAEGEARLISPAPAGFVGS
ncbi:penicillin-binding protein activator [Chelativorans sp. Marseille-P2723]|uniref:penicillin-binding protein activator n=1 Tax=Chelativorans sp. Marseille-P2723 TaxID=2709133 RepID=UPI001FEF7182|nr:penicillin-binding protein activator [Chelativorans sp. Marseille-P2723]